MAQAQQPPGWYTDPQGEAQLRYWDGNQWTPHVQNPPEHQVGGAPTTDVIVTTMNELPGYDITTVYGEVFGLVVRSRNVFQNIGASFRAIAGGELTQLTQLLNDSRLQAIERMKAAARARGGNAIIAMRFDCNEMEQMGTEVAAYRT